MLKYCFFRNKCTKLEYVFIKQTIYLFILLKIYILNFDNMSLNSKSIFLYIVYILKL